VHINVRKFQLKRSRAEVLEAAMAGLFPVLKASPGFQAHWVIECTDGDIAAVSIFDTETNSNAATDKILEWVNAHIRELVVLPPNAMFHGEARQLL